MCMSRQFKCGHRQHTSSCSLSRLPCPPSLPLLLLQLMTHDEGSCWLPAVLRPAILLTHWGRMDLGHISNTGYGPDNYTKPGR